MLSIEVRRNICSEFGLAIYFALRRPPHVCCFVSVILIILGIVSVLVLSRFGVYLFWISSFLFIWLSKDLFLISLGEGFSVKIKSSTVYSRSPILSSVSYCCGNFLVTLRIEVSSSLTSGTVSGLSIGHLHRNGLWTYKSFRSKLPN